MAGDVGCQVTPILHTVSSSEEMAPVRLLFRGYAASLGFDLGIQNLEQELAGLPGPYAPPSGCPVLATAGDEPAGCVVLKALADGACEMKWLYVRTRYRGSRLGRARAERVIREAWRLGYQAIRLDTVPAQMRSAVAL
jgi:hypothetical protein